MKTLQKFRVVCLLSAAIIFLIILSGCAPAKYFLQNRWSDFRDIGSLGIGVTSDNKYTGPIPPALGLYGEAGPLHLGFMGFGGLACESEMRGAGVYAEKRLRVGTIVGEFCEINQEVGPVITRNYYKDPVRSDLWATRMAEDEALSYMPAKDLIHDDERFTFKLLPRGWHTFEYTGLEVGVCDPFITHLGITLRAGLDVSEVMDFLLGWFWVDFRNDDRRDDE